MHAFTGAFTDEELAAVTNYVTAQFSGREGTVTASDVERSK
jgi:mono/diheme cytochrome c family protein